MTGPKLFSRKADRIDELAEGGTSLAKDALRRMASNPVAILGACIIAAFVLLAIFAPLLAPKDPFIPYPELQAQLTPTNIPGPMPGFLLGSDQNGYDFFSRLLAGARQTLIVGVGATIIGVTIGMIIGGIAGAFGGWIDTVLMRFTDILLSIPSLLLAISIAALFASGNQWTVIIAVAMVGVPVFARLLRGSMIAQRSSDHVLAATALGVRRRTIVLRHMLPNSVGPVIVQATLTLATAIIDAAALSFLGLGDTDWRRAEWGLMLGNSQDLLSVKPELAFYPAIAIIIVALGFTLLGESMREALDPKNRR
ncbi:ABC transporter permease [Prauserella marina]|uniref:Peptide/nickel transport system permease protein n=1 Tax=Prauserella marina TaxID=530584 RepID=A0A222VXM0_9PSEU|nr:ABC transporter permease [Prauserella marina]ASR38441.1 ABC transporter permease [Prauserella marina]PWV78318.1 peptide/nickel transport system permease protein [Prauserella marina]SDC83310.1 peptide/nickel transport system permease protein [Prauserella marina]